MVESCSFTQSDNLCLLPGVFGSFAFNVIIDIAGYNFTISYLFPFVPSEFWGFVSLFCWVFLAFFWADQYFDIFNCISTKLCGSTSYYYFLSS